MRGSVNLGYSYQCYGFGNISASDSVIVTGIGAKVTDRESCEVPTLMLRIHCRLRVSSAIASSSKLPLVLHGISDNSLYPYIEGTRAIQRGASAALAKMQSLWLVSSASACFWAAGCWTSDCSLCPITSR